MQRICCRRCGTVIVKSSILGIGHFQDGIGKYQDRSFVAFKCPVCKKVRYQFLPSRQDEMKDKILHGKSDSISKKNQLLKSKRIDIDQVILFYEKLKEVDSMDGLFELLESSYSEKNTEI